MNETVNNIFALMRGVFQSMKTKKCGRLLRAEKGVRIMKNNGEITLGDRVFLHRHVKLSASGVTETAQITIGNKSYIGDNTEIHAGHRVAIGNGVNIAWGCNILDRDYHKFCSETEKIEDVIIEDNVWIGCGCTILKGVTIGEGAVIGAGSVVTKDVPKHALAVGNPAGVVRENVYWKP